MRALRLRRRIVWLLAIAALGVGSIVGASAAAAGDTPSPDDAKWETDPSNGQAGLLDAKWE